MEHGSISRRGERWAPARWARVCYGVDAGGEQPVIVRAEKRRGRFSWEALPAGAVLPAERETGHVVAACLHAGESFTRWIEAPFPSLSKAGRVFPTLLDIQLPFPLEDCVYAFLAAHAEQDTTQALAVAARVSAVQTRLDALQDTGIDPLILDQEGLALWSCSLSETPPDEPERHAPRIVVSLGAAGGTLAVGAGERFLGAHRIVQDDAGQVSRVLKSYFEDRPSKVLWFWCGSGSEDAARVKALHSQLAETWPGPSVVHDDPRTFLARALAARALLPGPLRCNLRSGALAHGALKHRAGLLSARAAALFLAAGLLLCAANLGWRSAARRREASLDRSFNTLRDELAGYPVGAAKGEQALGIVRDMLDKRTSGLAPFRRAFEPSLARRIEAIVRAGAANGLQYATLSIDDADIVVGGTGEDWNKCETLSALLTDEGYDVTLDRKPALDNARIPFAVRQEGKK